MSAPLEEKSHKLQSKWTLWYDPPQDAKSWKDLTEPVLSFDSVESFWRLVNNIRPPNRLKEGSNYHLFKDGIRPTWEDVQNAEGGKWTIFVSDNLTALWLFTV